MYSFQTDGLEVGGNRYCLVKFRLIVKKVWFCIQRPLSTATAFLRSLGWSFNTSLTVHVLYSRYISRWFIFRYIRGEGRLREI